MSAYLRRFTLSEMTWFKIAAFVVAFALASLSVLPVAVGQEAAVAAPTPTEASEQGPLDGLQFIAGIVRSSDGADMNSPLEDRLVFSDGKFSSVVCQRYNFVSAPYWIRLEGARIHFLAELTSPTDGTMVWKGTVEDGKLDGTMRWTRKRWYWTIDAEHKIRGEIDVAAHQNAKN